MKRPRKYFYTNFFTGKAAGLIEAFFGIGSLFGPSIGGIFYDLGGFKLPFFFLGGISLILAFLSVILFRDVTREDEDDQMKQTSDDDVKWLQVLKAPGVVLGLLGTTLAATAWQWYAASVEVHFDQTFSLSSTNTGLVLMSFGAAYTIATPVFGLITDRGFSGLILIILGNLIIALSFTFLGPIPPLNMIIEHRLWIYVLCLIFQGLNPH